MWHQGTGHFWAISNSHLNISHDSEVAKAGSDIFQCFDAVLKLLDSCSFFFRMQTSVGKLEAATAELKRGKRMRERETDWEGWGERERQQ